MGSARMTLLVATLGGRLTGSARMTQLVATLGVGVGPGLGKWHLMGGKRVPG